MTPETFVSEYEKALSTQKWEKVSPLIHANCVVTFSNGTFKGKSDVEKAFRKNFDLIKNEEYSVSNVHWVIKSKEFAIFIFNFRWTGIVNGKMASGSGRGSSTIVNNGESWLLISEHLGPNA